VSIRNPVQGVFALRYADRTLSERGEHFYGHDAACHDTYPIDYFVWAIARADDVVLFDTGFSRATAEKRGARNYHASPAELVERLGRRLDEVQHVVLSHLHYDHAGTVADFPSAQFHLQRSEYDFWTGPLVRRGSNFHLIEPADLESLASLLEQGRLVLHDGDFELGDDVRVHHVGGHTAGLQITSADTPAGVVVLAADASHFYENIESDRPYSIVHTLPAMHAAFDTLMSLAGPRGVIVPGHEPRVAERHPAVPGTGDLIFSLSPDSVRTRTQPSPVPRKDLPHAEHP
jgi:glyoxylase-like metal-dependent hydrolase (beta-lactamase superfamily II)